MRATCSYRVYNVQMTAVLRSVMKSLSCFLQRLFLDLPRSRVYARVDEIQQRIA